MINNLSTTVVREVHLFSSFSVRKVSARSTSRTENDEKRPTHTTYSRTVVDKIVG